MNARRKALRMLVVFVAVMTPLWASTAAFAQAKPGLWEEVKKRGKIVVATEALYYPFEFIEDGKIVGYNKDIFDLMVKTWGIQVEQLDLPFAGIMPGLLQKKYDAIVTALLMTPERVGRFAFTMPVAEVRLGILTRKGDTKVKSASDLPGMIVGTPPPISGSAQFLMKHNDTLKAAGKPLMEVKHFQSSPDASVALANRQVDAVVDSTPPLLGAMRSSPNTYEMMGTIGDPLWIGWVTRPEDTDLRDAFNVEIRKLRDSGELRRLQQKWFGYTMEIPTSGYLPPGAK